MYSFIIATNLVQKKWQIYKFRIPVPSYNLDLPCIKALFLFEGPASGDSLHVVVVCEPLLISRSNQEKRHLRAVYYMNQTIKKK